MYIFILIYLVYIFYKSKNSLYMLQQNLYDENHRYLKWINKNKNKCFNIFDFITIVLSISLLFISGSFYYLFVYSLIDIILVLALYVEYKKNSNGQNKIKFKVTSRIKRLYFTEFIIVIGFLILLVLNNFNIINLVILLILLTFNYHYIFIIKLINTPVEKLVYFYYHTKAKNKLKSMPNLKVVGITGSYGKTSSKNILSHILSCKYITRPTPKNLNTPYGLMITINNYIDCFDEVFISEMGAYVPGEIENMCHFVKPKYGILTVIGDAHLETFKNKDNTMKAKFELIENLSEDGACVLNLDDPYQVKYVNNYLKNKVKILWVGIDNKDAMFNAVNIKCDSHGTNFDLIYNDNKYHIETKLLGFHNVYNIISSVALGVELKVKIEEMIKKIKTIKPVEHRLEIKKVNNITMIDDAYNSNPVGASNALDVLDKMNGVKVVVTPGMIELGQDEDKLNYEFGAKIATVADKVILVGEEKTKIINKALLDNNYDKKNIIVLNKVVDAFPILESIDGNVYALFENDLPDIYSEGGSKK